MKNRILIAITFIITTLVVVVLLSRSQDTAPLTELTQILGQNGDKETLPDLTEWKTYTNDEVGISFRYPDIFQRVDSHISEGTTGKIFSGVLEFEPNHWISFGGATKDHTASRGGGITDTYGYEKQGERYIIKFAWEEKEVTPKELWPINGGENQAIVIRDTEIDQILSHDGIAVFFNIPNSSFPGMVFEITPTSPGKAINEEEIKILHKIISSITFNK